MPQTQHEELRPMLPDAGIERVTVPKWVRVAFGGRWVADSRRVILVRGRPPIYYFPPEDVRQEFLSAADSEEGSLWSVVVGDRVAERAAWNYTRQEDEPGELGGYIGFQFDALDAWFEEDEQIYVHPRDPYTRIDVWHSSREVKVVCAAKVVAHTSRSVLLFETGLPTRYYLPKVDVRMDLLELTDHHTHCPYKGTASYYSVRVGDTVRENVAWYYPFPQPQVAKIQNLIGFYDETIDEFYVDGQRLPKAEVPFS